jgi:hypothetical protein
MRACFSGLRPTYINVELQVIITEGDRTRESASTIREFLLKVLQEGINGKKKLNDEIWQEAPELIEELGPSAVRNVPTNVEAEQGYDATAHEIVRGVVRA